MDARTAIDPSATTVGEFPAFTGVAGRLRGPATLAVGQTLPAVRTAHPYGAEPAVRNRWTAGPVGKARVGKAIAVAVTT